jgi:purine-binding chemotaxis protein CheW
MNHGEMVSVVVCTAGSQQYAIPVSMILEVAALVRVTALPDAPPEVLGVVNRGGEVIPLLDLRRCVGQPVRPLGLSTVFIVVACAGITAGLVVDDIQDVVPLPANAFRLPAQSGPFIQGLAVVGEAPLLVLHVEALLQHFAPDKLTG